MGDISINNISTDPQKFLRKIKKIRTSSIYLTQVPKTYRST